jgi:hypothetical protein
VIAVDMVSFGFLYGALVDAFVNDDVRGEDARQIARRLTLRQFGISMLAASLVLAGIVEVG